ncbi:hypothetical protein [uncultured Oceanicoccus sp.]|uniref:hypothetical protein n=1 Tax=uncultured Oceanicoccus sp. TaxID=1706381 RepID=UPI0030DBC36F
MKRELMKREAMKKSARNRIFTQVNYRQFRQHLADITTNTVKGKGYETAIYDSKGDIQAIVHAASIDTNGRCYPAEYFILTTALAAVSEPEWQYAA